MLWRCWLGSRKGIWPVKTEQWGAGMVICLERGVDLHMAQRMQLPLTDSCLSKIQIRFYLSGTFWYRLTWVVPDKGSLSVCVCVCMRACVRVPLTVSPFSIITCGWCCSSYFISRQKSWSATNLLSSTWTSSQVHSLLLYISLLNKQ